MDELNKIKKEIEEKEKTMAGEKVVTTNSENKPVVTPEVSSNQNKVVFTPEVKESQVSDGLNRTKKSSEEVGDMVADIFKQGVVHVVSTDQGVQNEILGTAKKAVKDKVGAISSQTTKEAQESAYDAN
jgi:tRNA A-37 threonylcarbamoyl transferase component Bud32